ncbi:MAG: hypothetical protein WBA93_18120 [Microcoleaceae cyanobacterium]
MLYFIIVWIFLTITCLTIGTGLLNILKADCFDRVGDRLIISLWLGIVTLCVSLLATSLILPLSTLVGSALAIFLVSLSLLSPSTRKELSQFRSIISPKIIIGFLSLAVIIAAFTSQKIIWFDTGLYHLGSIRWLSEYGAVPGVALVNPKFGFTSSWFALAAPLTPKILGGKVGAITNGFIFLIATCQFLITLTHLWKNNSRFSDWFLTITSGIVLSIYTITALAGSPIVLSFSADVAVTLLIIITAWSFLIISHENHRKINQENQNFYAFDARIISLILSAGAVTIKLSALPILAIGLLYYICGKPWRIQRLVWGICIVAVILLPMLIFAITTSGCPLYPSTFMCFDVPWSITKETFTTVTNEVNEIKFWGKLSDSDSTGISAAITPLWNWFKQTAKAKVMTLLTIISIVGTAWSFKKSNNQQIPGERWLMGLGLLGITFILTQSPLLRFGLGYFILVPSFITGYFCQTIFDKLKPQLSNRLSLISQGMLSQAMLLVPLFLVGLTIVIVVSGSGKNRLLLPPELPTAKPIYEQVNDVKYVYPDNWTARCWAADLPCAAVPIKHNIKLRNPSAGIGGGFVHAE